MQTRTDWSGVKDRVIAAKEAERSAQGRPPRTEELFEPPLTVDELAEIEIQYGVTLPEEYRSFLTQVGAGGPGPELALTSLRRVDGIWGWIWDTAGDIPFVLDPSGPFVETEGWLDHQRETLRAAGREPGDPRPTNNSDPHFQDEYQEVFGEAGIAKWYEDRERGAIFISDSGCGMTNRLVAVGPHRGEVRFRDCGYNEAYSPVLDGLGNPHTFRTWYLEWLERLESQTHRSASSTIKR